MDLRGHDVELDLVGRLVGALGERTMLDVGAERPPVWRDDEPLISLCVPTHEGRKEPLVALLEGAVAQAEAFPGLVEICVSDNASRDGTAEAVAQIASQTPCPIRYRRHDENLGLARNLLAAVELASGRYCWLFGSDDLLADRAVERASMLLAELPGAVGYAVGAIYVDADDPNLRSRALVRAFHPPGDRSRLIEGLDQIYDQCGNSWCVLSWTIVERTAWLRAVRAKEALILSHPVFPHIIVLATVAAERPTWGWLAEPLVRQRNATTYLFESGESALAERWSQIVAGAASAWAAVLGGRGTRRWRHRMRMLQKVWGDSADVRGSKLYESPSLRSQVHLALVYLAAFWPARAYWHDVMHVTLLPGRILRARQGTDSVSRPVEATLALSGDLPGQMPAGAVESVTLRVHNVGASSVLTDGPRSCTIAQRWSTDGHELTAAELGINSLAELPRSLPRRIRRRHAVDVEVPLYAPPRPGHYRVELAGYQHGRGWLGADDDSQSLTAFVEVHERPQRLSAAMKAFVIRGTLAKGVEHLHAFEPNPTDAEALRTHLGRDPRVTVHASAVRSHDGSLGSLLVRGELPKRVGILRINGEGSGLEVLRGMGALETEVLIVARSADLLQGRGTSPSAVEDLIAELQPRDFSHFAFVVRRGELVNLKWDDAEVGPGAVDELVFLHDRAFERVAPKIIELASQLSDRVVAIAEQHMRAAAESLALAGEWQNIPVGRLARVTEIEQAADDRLQALDETTARAQELERTADDRLRALDETSARAHELELAADERLEALDETSARAQELEQAADDRLRALDETSARAHELELAADERLEALEQASARATQLEQAADERLQALEEIATRVRELERAADERLEALKETAGRASKLESAADERLGALEQTSARAARAEQAADERLQALEEASIRATQLEQAATDRLRALEEITTRAAELEDVARERLQALEETTARATELEQAASERLQALEEAAATVQA